MGGFMGLRKGGILFFCLYLSSILSGCKGEAPRQEDNGGNIVGEYLYRKHDEHLFVPPPQEKGSAPVYPWTSSQYSQLPKVTKEHFRCKGSNVNPVHTAEQNGELVRFYDCGGVQKHSLPLRDGKEFIYPVLIELLNDIQMKTGKRVVITSGYRCPEHNAYVDSSKDNQVSKHQIGAEVSFYVQGLENQPDKIVKLIQDYYKDKYGDKKEFVEFKRYEKENTNVSTQPWYNKEVFIKLFKKQEGRDFDNRHPYPYISIQVRYDLEKEQRVNYDWNTAFRNYLRY